MNHDPKSPGCPRRAPSSPASDKSRRGERPAHRAGRAPVGIRTRSRENPPRRWPPERTRLPVGRSCPPDTAQPHRTALRPRQPLGSTEVTHPFHPLRGHRFVVLKVRRVSGVDTLSLRHSVLGSFAMPREWTDWAPPNAHIAPADGKPLITDAFGLSALNELVASLTRKRGA